MKDIKWAVLGTGVIANEMAVALKKNGRNIYAVGNGTYDKAVAFAEKYGIGKVYSDYNEMFTDPEVDVIYITTPHNTHIQFMRRAIENGKHILVEKSITLNSDELEEMLELAEQLSSKGVEFVSKKEAIDTTTPTGKFMLTVFGAVAELEREYILQRQREGIAIAKANGVYKGRKPIQPPDFEKVMARWQRREITAAEALRQMGMSKSTFYRRVKGRCPLP